MRRILFMCLDAALAAVILIPLFLILNKRYFQSLSKTACYLIFAVYLSGVFAVVGLPTVNYIRFDPNFNFTPFAYMFSDFENSLLNVLLFMPLGFFLPVYWKHFGKLHRTFFFGFCMSLFIEILQIFTFRATDVNDLMTNTLGTILGWAVARLCLHISPSIAPSWKTKEISWIFGASFGVMFFLQPFLADLIVPFFF